MTERFRPYAAVYTLLRRGNEIFMLRRQGSGFYDGWYTVPSGHIDGNEPIAHAAAREALEEACVTINPDQLTLVHVLHRIDGGNGQGELREYLDFFFLASTWTGEPRLGELDKSDDGRWVTPANLPEQTLPYVREVLEKIATHQLCSATGFGASDAR